jgi:hypothetical protein
MLIMDLLRKLLSMVSSADPDPQEMLSSALTRPSSPLSYTPRGHENPRQRTFDPRKLVPPQTMSDPAAWNAYWQDQIESGYGGLGDMICLDGELIDEMRARGFQTVLCVGSGLSIEPHALAMAGFHVTALDLSPFAIQTASALKPSARFLDFILEGRSLQPNGRLQFVIGDLRDPAVCIGPYDVIIERRTLQLYLDTERSTAIEAVARRLALRGIFVSHAHDGRGEPGKGRHPVKDWFVREGWRMRDRNTPTTERIAWATTSTG